MTPPLLETTSRSPWPRLLLPLAVALPLLSSSPPFARAVTVNLGEDDSGAPLIRELVDWVKSKGAYINPKQEFRHEVPSDRSSVRGIFATEPIKKGDLLSSIPWAAVVEGEYDDTAPAMHCDLVRNLVREMKLGNESEYAPYARYLLSQPRGQVPSDWSHRGQGLFMYIRGGNGLPPDDPFMYLEFWHDYCEGERSALAEHAAMQVVQRAEDNLMVPWYDMYSHRNGWWLNGHQRVLHGERFEFVAARDIEAGEQIYNSYNQCPKCEIRMNTWGTPENFRDYGFVESMPQRWFIHEIEVAFDLDYKKGKDGRPGDELEVTWLFDWKPSQLEPNDVFFLRAELHRLDWTFEKKRTKRTTKIPPHEWEACWEYYDALKTAITHAIDSARSIILSDSFSAFKGCDTDENGTCAFPPEDLKEMDEEIVTKYATCHQFLDFEGHEDIELPFKTHYQEMFFDKVAHMNDKCLHLDDILQICASYRPHYHEPFVHFTAAYLSTVRRVVFVGGGDSMLLHEVLKYPTLELVLGLELDQAVVRSSFRHFRTQPHFDDERVQWWFGDAAKSINVLPRELFGTFDLVLVDLSETVMSLTVNKHFNILEALALLLKPDGIFVKNELYFEKLSTIFKYTVRLYLPDVPKLCDQDFVIGTNGVDFLAPNYDLFRKYDIETLLLKGDLHTHFALIHQYAKNDVSSVDEECINPDAAEADDDTVRAGLMMAIEAENVAGPLNPPDEVMEALGSAVERAGLTRTSGVSHPSKHGGSVAVIVAREGFVTAHTWPEKGYCAFDVHLWGRFDALEAVRDNLLEAVGGANGRWSSYRIIVAGMLGASTFEDDRRRTGPDMSLTRACRADGDGDDGRGEDVATTVGSAALDRDAALDAGIEGGVATLRSTRVLGVVFCGDRSQRICRSVDVLERQPVVSEVVPLWDCISSDRGEEGSDGACGSNLDLASHLKGVVERHGGIGFVVIDPSADAVMVDKARDIWSGEAIQEFLLKPHAAILIPFAPDETADGVRRRFWEDCRKNLFEPVVMADIYVGGAMNLGFVASGDYMYIPHLVDIRDKIKQCTGAEAAVRYFNCGEEPAMENFNAHFYTLDDYDRRPGNEQFAGQHPVGAQRISQFSFDEEGGKEEEEGAGKSGKGEKEDAGEGDKIELSESSLRAAIEGTLSALNMEPPSGIQIFRDVGQGFLLVASLMEGHVIAVWDGGTKLVLNVFQYYREGDSEGADLDVEIPDRVEKEYPGAFLVQDEEQPRGFDRTINFREDIDASSEGLDFS